MASFKRTIIAFALVPFLARGVLAGQSDTSRFVLDSLLDGYHIVNIVDDFLAFWNQAKDRAPVTQRRLWRRLVENKHRDYFDRAVYRTMDPDARRELLDEFLVRVPSQIEAIREFNKTINNLRGSPLVQSILFFKATFPEYRQVHDIYVGLSMFRFDGAVRPVQNDLGIPDTLCLGADVLSSYDYDQVAIAITHEFFHLYHFGFLFEQAQELSLADFRAAHMPLMIEGMAAAGAEAVFPYQQRELYLHFTSEQLETQEQNLAQNAGQFLGLIWDGAPPEQYGPWFTHSHLGDAPPRGGYLLGYQVVKRVMSAYTLEQMVRMSIAELREHAEEQLSAMASEGILLMAG